MLIPTLVPSERMPAWFNQAFNKKVQLGLDLQGGLYIVYGIDLDKAVDDKASEIEPIPIDTTAEPLGRAKPRRPRARVGAATPAAARSTRKTTAPKKPAARPTTRSRKTVRSDSGGKNES